MKLTHGEFSDANSIETRIGTVTFRDPNGGYELQVRTSGEFWRVVEVEWGGRSCSGALPSMTRKAARALAELLRRAADVAESERKTLKWPEPVDKVEALDAQGRPFK